MCRLSLRDELDSHVTRPLANPRGPPQSARTVALECRALVYICLADLEIVGDEVVVVLRVGDGGVQELQDIPRSRARRVSEYGTRLIDILAADVVDHEPCLARRMAHVAGARADRHIGIDVAARLALRLVGAAGDGLAAATAAAGLRLGLRVLRGGLALGLRSLRFGLLGGSLVLGLLDLGGVGGGLLRARAALRLRLLRAFGGRLRLGGDLLLPDPLVSLLFVLVCHQRIRALSPPAWPRKRRVGANSPSLCPTIDSDTNTGTCLRPSCTAIVWPTISGKIVEVRDQVLIICFCPLEFIASMRDIRRSSTHGPFFELRDIQAYLLPFPRRRRRTMSRSEDLFFLRVG